MGNRLVTLIESKNGKFLAGSYQHWSAGDAEYLHDILDRKYCEEKEKLKDKEFTAESAVNVLVEMLTEFNGGLGRGGMYTHKARIYNPETRSYDKYISKKQKVFNDLHSIPIGHDRTDGLITVDEVIAKEWENIAEDVNAICDDC